MSSDPICDKELAALLKRAAAALDSGDAADDRDDLISSLDHSANLLEARRDRTKSPRSGSKQSQDERPFLTRLAIALFWTFVPNPAVWIFVDVCVFH